MQENRMSKSKQLSRELRCFCFKANLLDGEVAIGYVMETSEKEAEHCIETYILNEYGAISDLNFVRVEGDEDVGGAFNPSHPRYKGEISSVVIDDAELAGNVCRSLFGLLDQLGITLAEDKNLTEEDVPQEENINEKHV